MSLGRRNRGVLMILAGVAMGMLGLAYASVPLYRLFCAATGFEGTTRRAEAAPDAGNISARTVTVTFTADIDQALPWRFQPQQHAMTVRVGEVNLAYFTAENLSDKPVTGRAVFNVSPDLFGRYFNKIECFCFKEQTLQPGERIDMPVSFFLDPAMLQDPYMAHMQDVTLAYTFFKAADQTVGDAVGKKSAADNLAAKELAARDRVSSDLVISGLVISGLAGASSLN